MTDRVPCSFVVLVFLAGFMFALVVVTELSA